MNIATLRSAPGFTKHITFCKKAKINLSSEDIDLILANEIMIQKYRPELGLPNKPSHQPHLISLNINTFNSWTTIPNSSLGKDMQLKNEAELL